MSAPHSSDVPRSRRAVTLTDLDQYDQVMLPNGDGAHGLGYMVTETSGSGRVELDTSNTAQGAHAAFVFHGHRQIAFDKKFPVGAGQRYRISGYARTLSGEGLLYVGIRYYNAYDSAIGVANFMWDPDRTTTLARDLKIGDTEIHLTDSTGWPGTPGTPDVATYRSAIVWNYVDPGGKHWPIDTYSQNYIARNAWAHGAIDPDTHIITLRTPHFRFEAPAGTPISVSSYSGGMAYLPSVDGVVPAHMPSTHFGWWEFGNVTPPMMVEGGPRLANWESGVPPGAAYFQVHVLPNFNSTSEDDVVAVSDLSVSEAGGAFDRAERVSARLQELHAGAGWGGGRPVNPVVGQQYFDTTIMRPIWWIGDKWINASGGTV